MSAKPSRLPHWARIALAAGLAFQTATASHAQNVITRDLSVEQREIHDVIPPRSSLEVKAWVDRQDDTYRTGDVLQLFVKPNQDAYVTIVDVGTSGKVHVIFPNKHQTDNRVLAHQVLQIPGPDASWRIRVGGPPGQNLIKVIATLKPEAVINQDRLAELGPLYQYRDTARALTRDLGVELNERHRGGAATFEKIVRIVSDSGALPPRAAAQMVPAAAVKQQAPAPVTSAEDLFKLGEAHFYGDGGKTNRREALRYFSAAADGGHVGAMFFIGQIHEAGVDVDANPVQAQSWYRKAAELGNTQAMVRLAMMQARVEGPARDLGEMSRWLRKAASQGDTMAMIHVARMYDEGFGTERAPKESAKHLLAALKGGAWTVVDQIARFSEETRREVQTVLRRSGHYKGPVEGRIGAETRAAMVEWARAG